MQPSADAKGHPVDQEPVLGEPQGQPTSSGIRSTESPQRDQMGETDSVTAWITAHESTSMRGWDFSVLDGRLRSDDPPWDFEQDCLDVLSRADRVLDLGTGGGERLRTLMEQLAPEKRPEAIATEGWAPNVPVAREHLAPLGVDVVEHDPETGQRFPFQDEAFDLVMCRHEACDVTEVARILAPGAALLSQQVEARDAQELRDWFGGEPQYPDVRLDVQRVAMERAGLIVDVAEEWAGRMEFSDTEALLTLSLIHI